MDHEREADALFGAIGLKDITARRHALEREVKVSLGQA
jgi:hypothetical protein